jgi:hypothetical protein
MLGLIRLKAIGLDEHHQVRRRQMLPARVPPAFGNERAQFEWIVSRGSMQEARDKADPGHMLFWHDVSVR